MTSAIMDRELKCRSDQSKIKQDTNFTMVTQQLQQVDNRSIIFYSNHSISV